MANVVLGHYSAAILQNFKQVRTSSMTSNVKKFKSKMADNRILRIVISLYFSET